MGSLPLTAAAAKARGYCIVSRHHCLATRLDRKDWRAAMAAKHAGGDAWVKALGDHRAADFYRRCVGEDTITVPASWIKQLPNSGDGPAEFIP